jgi:DNA-binding NarL/FixJ family response regulator
MIAGDTATKIASDLFVSIKTIESHRLKIWGALGVKNVAQLIRWANDHGFLSLMGWDKSRSASKE